MMARRLSGRIVAFHHFQREMISQRREAKGKAWRPGHPVGRPIYQGQQREHVVTKVAKIMSGFETTPFQFEGPARHALRAFLCERGFAWAISDNEAASIVAEALLRLRAVRPTWEQGQKEYTVPRENCSWCQRAIPEDMAVGNHNINFCSTECAKAARRHRDFQSFQSSNRSYKAISDALVRLNLPPRKCAQCGKKYRPLEATSTVCSKDCSVLHAAGRRKDDLEQRNCEQCGTPYKAYTARARFCSSTCREAERTDRMAAAAGRKRLPRGEMKVKECEFCGDVYANRSQKPGYCSTTCRSLAQHLRTGSRRPRFLNYRIFDHMVRNLPKRLTPERFDQIAA